MLRLKGLLRRHYFLLCWKRFLVLTFVILLCSSFFLAAWKSDIKGEEGVNFVKIRGLKNKPTVVASYEKTEDKNQIGLPSYNLGAEIMAFKEMEVDEKFLMALESDNRKLESWITDREHEFQKRRKRVESICKKFDVGVQYKRNRTAYLPRTLIPNYKEDLPMETVDLTNFSLARNIQTMTCLINKVASSSLATAFLTTMGFGPEFTSPHSMVGYLRPKDSHEFLVANSSFLNILFVRHPFVRLLSCYRDKMITSPHWSLPAFRRHIRQMSRKIIAARKLIVEGLPHPPIEERLVVANRTSKYAVEEVTRDKIKQTRNITEIDKSKHILRKLLARPELPQASGDRMSDNSQGKGSSPSQDNTSPTFAEFLEYILATDLEGQGYDSHWVPYWKRCTPCHVHYDVIGKLETAEEDFLYVWKKTGLDSRVPIPFVNSNKKVQNEHQKDLHQKDLQKIYYSSLPRDLILRVFRRFRLDFEMFDYNINEVLEKGGHLPITEEELQ